MEKARVQLITAHPFYAVILHKCIFSWNDQIPTAGVMVNRRAEIELIVNKKFFYELEENERVGLLMHEMLHLVMGHLSRGKELNKQVANIAMDIAINQFIPRELLPKGGLLPEQFNLYPGHEFEHYYVELMKQAQTVKGQMKIDGSKTLDDHDLQDQSQGQAPGEGDEQADGAGAGNLSQELIDSTIANAVKEAAQETKSTYPGNVPQAIDKIINEMGKSEVRWQDELRKYIGRNMSDHRESTRNRANRRLGLKAPGWKRDYTPKLVIACDQSGSVDDRMVAALLSEASAILKTQADKTEVVYFDTQVAKVEKLTNLSKPNRYASGGTDFACAFDYAKKAKTDLLIVLTDGEASMPPKPSFPVLWVIAGDYQDSHLLGKKVRIKV